MEKFSQWRDGATGIAPFFPYTDGLTVDKSGTDVVLSILGYLLAVITLPFTVAAFLLYFIAVQYLPFKVRSTFLQYILLPALHVWAWDVAHEGVKQRRWGYSWINCPYSPLTAGSNNRRYSFSQGML
jgi:hypothetical protein